MKRRVSQEGLPADAEKPVDRVELGRILREGRQACGRVLEDVAEGVGVSVPFLSDFERGKRNIEPAILDKLAKAVKLPRAHYVRVFQILRRLPPDVEARMVRRPEDWG